MWQRYWWLAEWWELKEKVFIMSRTRNLPRSVSQNSLIHITAGAEINLCQHSVFPSASAKCQNNLPNYRSTQWQVISVHRGCSWSRGLPGQLPFRQRFRGPDSLHLVFLSSSMSVESSPIQLCWWGCGKTGPLIRCWWDWEQRNWPCIPVHLTFQI